MRVLIGADRNDDVSDDDLTKLYTAEASAAKPWMRCNMVSTVDGSATGVSGDSGSINNDADGRVFHTLRALADVIIVGAGTAKVEQYGPADVPIVLVSRKAQVPESLRGAPAGSVYMATCSRSDGIDSAREILGEEHVLTLGSHRVDLPLLKRELAERGWVNQLCEGGPHLLRDLVFQGCVDELTATTVPQIVGGANGRITEGAPVDTALELTLLLEDAGTLLGRWRVKN
ncbi:Riboflavin biosynthesis protein RibD [Nocardioides dokdonensis FR1436]|uniref:Riboflavin biosynthesis protein RibD n=1 Tax=Nocardioides dokdonensis FR1436 TaxID=1300347 RepID=A0A1A9GIT4_9ACTN|nr:dihydrofolate reductase family protein [Nocardioides dokdonensis]ANH38219.1 Riboflavin biosynthesis protein RibD [Nocardioides dokdonensis FR1436]